MAPLVLFSFHYGRDIGHANVVPNKLARDGSGYGRPFALTARQFWA